MSNIAYYRISEKSRNLLLNSDIKLLLLDNFLNEFKNFQTIIIADNCSSEFLKKLTTFNCTIHETNLGNRGSFLYSLNLAIRISNENTVLFFVEDDYFFKKNSSKNVIDALNYFDYITIYEHPDKIRKLSHQLTVMSEYTLNDFSELTRLIQIKDEIWRTTTSTTMTFLTTSGLLRKDIFWWRFNIGKFSLPLDKRCWIFLTRPSVPNIKNISFVLYFKYIIFFILSIIFQNKRLLGVPFNINYAIHLDQSIESVVEINNIISNLNESL
jgi:hypothetical protein